jgi:2-polyprenyl-3-methyl-5-hydroxy-6-metoxy-1,4-benzoquinol methylase
VLLAERVLAESWPPGTEAIEIGCGLGLAGLAALRAGMRVAFSDYSPAALELAAHNARLNGFDQFQTRRIDWQTPPIAEYPVVLGADVLYEQRCVSDVLRMLEHVLAPTGVALLADPNRATADPFTSSATAAGFDVECEPAICTFEGSRQITGRIFRVRRARPT